MSYSVFYPTKISELSDCDNDNIDVCITLENGTTYTLVFITPANLKEIMQKDGVPYVDPHFRFIVVERLTEHIIESVISNLVSDECLLHEYGI